MQILRSAGPAEYAESATFLRDAVTDGIFDERLQQQIRDGCVERFGIDVHPDLEAIAKSRQLDGQVRTACRKVNTTTASACMADARSAMHVVRFVPLNTPLVPIPAVGEGTSTIRENGDLGCHRCRRQLGGLRLPPAGLSAPG